MDIFVSNHLENVLSAFSYGVIYVQCTLVHCSLQGKANNPGGFLPPGVGLTGSSAPSNMFTANISFILRTRQQSKLYRLKSKTNRRRTARVITAAPIIFYVHPPPTHTHRRRSIYIEVNGKSDVWWSRRKVCFTVIGVMRNVLPHSAKQVSSHPVQVRCTALTELPSVTLWVWQSRNVTHSHATRHTWHFSRLFPRSILFIFFMIINFGPPAVVRVTLIDWPR